MFNSILISSSNVIILSSTVTTAMTKAGVINKIKSNQIKRVKDCVIRGIRGTSSGL